MMGTLATVLAKKKIRTTETLFRARVTGDIEDVNGVLKITRIGVRYELNVPEGKRGEADEAFANYLQLCPAAQSVIGCIAISHELQLTAISE
jgi:organic hydroperoxide reductase OsmC/OhrA